ncbi:MAG: hypothetical protein ABIR68_02040 [Ilumatobacteraceae bacterium]
MLHGHDNTTHTLDAISNDLRELQLRVDQLSAKLDLAFTGLVEMRERQLTEFEAVREAVITATDDLSTRVAALHRDVSASS